ncbi:hypothetical protein B0H14DRAFT_2588953 [Mycena olivaceomarginata]|nr:hypothetical protein B0H14DRAFT_2588953 [Mycena olivaceomarginata]
MASSRGFCELPYPAVRHASTPLVRKRKVPYSFGLVTRRWLEVVTCQGFRHILEQDQEKQGQKTYTDSDIPNGVDDFRQQIDNIIDIGVMDVAMDVATSAQDQPSAA